MRDGVPIPLLACDGNARTVGDLSDDGRIQRRAGAYVQTPAAGGNDALAETGRLNKRNAEEFRHRKRKRAGDKVDVVFNPFCVALVIMIRNLDKHGGCADTPQLGEGGIGHRANLFGIGINVAEIGGDDLCRFAAARAGGVVIHIGARLTAHVAHARGVGMQRKMQTVVAAVGIGDDLIERHIIAAARKADAAGDKIRLHCVGDEIHIIFLAAAAVVVDVEILPRGA